MKDITDRLDDIEARCSSHTPVLAQVSSLVEGISQLNNTADQIRSVLIGDMKGEKGLLWKYEELNKKVEELDKKVTELWEARLKMLGWFTAANLFIVFIWEVLRPLIKL